MEFKDKKAERVGAMKRRMSLLRSYLRQAEKAQDEHRLNSASNGFWYYNKR